MIKLFNLFFLLGIIASSCDSVDPCENKELYIQNHIAFIKGTADHKDSYSLEDWEKRDEEFQAMVEECFKTIEPKLSKEEKKAFWIRNTKYLSYRIKSSAEESILAFTDILEDLSLEGVNISEGLQAMFGDDFEASIEAFGQDIQQVFDEDFKNRLKDVFDEDFENDIRHALKNLEGNLKEIKGGLEEALEEINIEN